MTYTRGEYVIGIGSMPKYKKPCLFIGNKYCIRKIASFDSDGEAEQFTGWLEYFFGLRKNPVDGGDQY